MARKILLADDSVTAQNMGRKILTDAGYEVIAVNNGSAALKKIAEHKPDLIVLDVYMPGYSGLEVCQRIKENRETARIPVLLTVGKLEPFKPEEARRARADAFVVKPFEASELLTALAKLEEKIAPQPEPYKQGRFAKAIASVEESESGSGEKFGDTEGGWKSRLRFPSSKKKAPEPEEAPEFAAPSKNAREFREEPAPLPPPTPTAHEFERPVPEGIPRDITPEEIAAISAAAARLSGASAPDFVSNPSVPESPVPQEPTAQAATASEPVSQPSATEISPTPTLAPEPPVVETSMAGMVEPLPTVDLQVAHPEIASHGDLGPITFASAPIQEPDAVPEVAGSVHQPTPVSQPVSEYAPEVVSAESPIAPVQDVPEANAASQSAAPIPELVQPLPVDPSSEIVSAVQTPPEPQPVVVVSSELQAESPAAAQSEVIPAPPIEQAAAQPEMPVPAPAAHDEEVMAALQTLIPAHESASAPSASFVNSVPPSELVAAVSEFAHAGVPVLRPRWIAEETVLTAEEASASLEQEMEKAYAAFAASEAARLLATSAIASMTPVRSGTDVSVAIADAHAATSESEQPSTAPSPVGDTISDAQAPSVAEAAEPAPVYAMVSAAAAGDSGATSSGASVISVPHEDRTIPLESQSAASSEPVPTAPTAVADPPSVPAEPGLTPAVTDFEVPTSAAPGSTAEQADLSAPSVAALESVDFHPPVQEEPVGLPTPAIADVESETNSAGGIDDMGKNSESGFKMIRQSPAGSKSPGSAAPVSKENFEVPAAAASEPAALAAAAAGDASHSAAPSSAPDPRAIASIVDSVLAELRPRIVEEIARKLAEPKKE